MIIDIILDRRAGSAYSPLYILRYTDRRVYKECFQYIQDAFLDEDNNAVQLALCRYIDEQGYCPDIKQYILSVNWLRESKGVKHDE